jgi:hypothetical protein
MFIKQKLSLKQKKQSNKSLVLRNRLFQVKARRTVEEVGEGA